MDYNATTPVDPEVVKVITDALTDAWGNPSSNYVPGMRLSKINMYAFLFFCGTHKKIF